MVNIYTWHALQIHEYIYLSFFLDMIRLKATIPLPDFEEWYGIDGWYKS